MYAVIFEAEAVDLGEEYQQLSARMRKLAMDQYGCRGVSSVTEGERKITISYWDSLEQIREWKQNSEHLAAQQLGKSRFFREYRAQVVEIIREYGFDSN